MQHLPPVCVGSFVITPVRDFLGFCLLHFCLPVSVGLLANGMENLPVCSCQIYSESAGVCRSGNVEHPRPNFLPTEMGDSPTAKVHQLLLSQETGPWCFGWNNLLDLTGLLSQNIL